jgi:uncharacterized protein YacL (UPF0231 family)
MITELQFLEYIETQLISAGDKVYTEWLKQEIRYRRTQLNNALSTVHAVQGEKE